MVRQAAVDNHAGRASEGSPSGTTRRCRRLAAASWSGLAPALQRRPDIAASERAVAAANAQIGIQRSAYFPSLGLSASFGNAGSRIGDLFGASTSLWSLGLSVAQTLFDAGATRARVEGAEASRDAAVARYRQTVLSAFQVSTNAWWAAWS